MNSRGAAQEKPTSPQRAFEKAVWRAIESYPGTVEIDNVQRFREHLWREPHRDYAGRTCTTGLLHSHEAAAATPSLRHVIETISMELQHYDLSDDPGYIRVPTERVRAVLRARLDEGSATPDPGKGEPR